MSETTAQASAVIIGAGIVGNSIAYHLARLGWRDLVLLDKGPMPNPGGSTGHASNFIYPIDYSKMMMELTADSAAQYKELGVHIESGGLEVARRPAAGGGVPPAGVRGQGMGNRGGDPGAVRGRRARALSRPGRDPVRALYFPRVGVVDSLRAGTLMRERAQELGALEVRANTEVLGIDTDASPRPQVTCVRTTTGDIETDVVAICCGVWSPRLAAMAGASIPLTPIVHQMISVGPIPLFAGTSGEIEYPIVRDVDTNMYERQHGGDLEVGSYAHRPILVAPSDIPSNEEASLSPTELPFTQDDFDPQLAEALELMPELLGDEKVGIRYAINGLISMTPDGHPVLGETPEVAGLWSVAASWIKEGPGIGRAVAEWMTGEPPEIDVHEADVARFYDFQRTRRHIRSRAAESFNKMYGIVHPAEQWEGERGLRRPPMYERERSSGRSSSRPPAGSGPTGTRATRPSATATRGASCAGRPSGSRGGGPRSSTPSTSPCATPAASSTCPPLPSSTSPDRLPSTALQAIAVAQLDVAPGRVVYTSFLDERGGFRADLTDHAARPRTGSGW